MDELTTFDMKTIEQLEQEKADILAKALNLVAKIRNAGPFAPSNLSEEIAAIEALKPEREPRRCWVARFDGLRKDDNGFGYAWKTEQRAKDGDSSADEFIPMIEIRPIGEVPTWEEWEVSKAVWIKVKGGNDIFCCHSPEAAENLVARHNSTARRLQSFIDQLLAERGEA